MYCNDINLGRVRDRLGFCQSGSGSGLVFVFFKSRVRVLPCRVSGFGRVSNLPKKEVHFGKKSESFKIVKKFLKNS